MPRDEKPRIARGEALMIVFKHRGSFKNTERFFKQSLNNDYRHILRKYAQKGVDILTEATPVDTGKTARSWDYEIHTSINGYSISWTNSNVVSGVPIAIILNYGHGTRNGGYVHGLHYIQPAIRPVLKKLADALWKEVIR